MTTSSLSSSSSSSRALRPKHGSWDDMDMEWIHHHNPDLVVFDDSGREKERIDLNGFSRKKLEDLLESRGFRRR